MEVGMAMAQTVAKLDPPGHSFRYPEEKGACKRSSYVKRIPEHKRPIAPMGLPGQRCRGR